MAKRLQMLVIVVALAGCGGGSSGGPGSGGGGPDVVQLCPYISGSGATVEPVAICSGCELTGADLAIDGVVETYASITIPALTTASPGLLATAPSGTVYPAMSKAGAVLSRSSGSSLANSGFELRTFYAGAPVGASPNGGTNLVGGGGGSSPSTYEFTSPSMYDGVEATYVEGASPGINEIRIYEFCGGDD